MSSTVERLGYPKDSRLVVLMCDGLGSSNGANQAIFESLRNGLATTAALQVPCPWAQGAAADYQGEDVGVSLTFNAEFDLYRWGPITQSPSLFDGKGGLPATATDLWEHADLDEVRREAAAQIERAILWGFDPSFLHAHMNTLSARPEFFGIYLDLAVEYRLPITLPNSAVDLGFPAYELAAEEGILVANHTLATRGHPKPLSAIAELIQNLKPGVTLIETQPALDTPETRALDPDWPQRVADAHLTISDWDFRAMVQRSGAELIGFCQLRQAQRKLSD